jgi:polysaccharide pyruvyl transferase WcaK-like protein
MEILRRTFGPNVRATVASYGFPAFIEEQARSESDPAIRHVALPTIQRWSPRWFLHQVDRRCLGGRLHVPYRGLRSSMDALVALQIGGDNYSLDYCRPDAFLALDRFLFARRVPVVLWGASVGPFDADPGFASIVYPHLRRMAAILVRERESYDYLRAHGVEENLHLVADPAFAMAPAEPAPGAIGCDLPEQAIGINLSPLMARYVTGGNPAAWVVRCVEIVRRVAETAGRPVLLIPHVTCAGNDDHALLGEVARRCAAARVPVACVGGGLSAPELKWIIARCATFLGARTHGTIAAMSAMVPTISLAYSRKARGLNQEMFGCQDYCIPAGDLLPDEVARRVQLVLGRGEAIRRHLAGKLPAVREASFRGGEILRQKLGLTPPVREDES